MGRWSACPGRGRHPGREQPGGHADGFTDTFKQLYRAVYRAVEAGAMRAEPDFPTFADGHRGMQVLEATLRSADEGGWVKIA